jgi:hypothetical protein
MILDLAAFGAGLGSVVACWSIGLVVSFAFALVRRIGGLG